MRSKDDDELLGALYASVTHDDALATMLGLLAERFTCPSAVLIYVDPLRPEADMAVGHGLVTPALIRSYQLDFAAIDPAPAIMARLPIGTAVTTSRLMAGEEAKHARFLDEFYYAVGFADTLGGPVVNHHGRFGIVAVHRGPARVPFDDDDIADFERLMPHVTQAVELRRAFFEIQSESASLKNALEPGAAGILVVSRTGRVLHANQAARAILDRRDGLMLNREGILTAANGTAMSELTTAFATLAAGGGPTLVRRLSRGGGADPYAVRIARHAGELVEGVGPEGFVLTLHDPDRVPDDVAPLLATVFQMTPASAALVAALLEGHDLQSYARAAGISVNTVKFHLKTAFGATGTRRQTELVRKAGAMLRDMALRPAHAGDRRGAATDATLRAPYPNG